MAVTASRLGSAPITVDWAQIKSPYEPDTELYTETWNKLKQRFNPQDVGFYDCPINNDLSAATQAEELAGLLLKKNTFTDCLFLGIGGSALGPISLLSSLQEKTSHTLRFHFVENPDPIDWKNTLKKLPQESTLVVVVTKSGTTFETMAQALLALEWLGKELWKSNFVAITDPAKGDLRSFVTQEGLMSLPIAPAMGGRFSVLTPVGLFPAALAGLSVSSILQGARQVRDYIEKTPAEKNPIFIVGDQLIRLFPKRPVHVCMPYSTRLRLIGNWFVQLWSESLGKDGKGFTPVAAVGATDQHSILQLLRDGPDDKVTLFMTVDQVNDEVKIPAAPFGKDRKVYPAFQILEGHTLHDLLEIEYRATSLVLTKQARPHLTIRLDRLDERSIGALYFMFSTLTAFTGTLWNVNPFDQPGVEESKIYIRQALSQGPPPEEENTAVSRLRRE
jgi:glucose-6-phosphate isomerase